MKKSGAEATSRDDVSDFVSTLVRPLAIFRENPKIQEEYRSRKKEENQEAERRKRKGESGKGREAEGE